ncbi:MAG: nitrilase-related carbon-nitrogen hydrolase [Staphylococcus epidermidis]|nr:nitrilase-related carbon-nitrogen hydrolase [Staphylococcus epidermidis]
MKIQILQFNVERGNVDKNMQNIKTKFNQYLDKDTSVVVLPEMWNNGYALEELEQKADKNLKDSSLFIKDLAHTFNVDIIAGSVSNIRENHIYNTAFAINKNKELINEYDKVHLVPMLREPDFLCGGNVVPDSRLDHWLSLLKARAIENDIFIVACNSCGDDGHTNYAGNSIVINPNGEILGHLDDKEGVLTTHIDVDLVDQQREYIPVFRNLKPHLYK